MPKMLDCAPTCTRPLHFLGTWWERCRLAAVSTANPEFASCCSRRSGAATARSRSRVFAGHDASIWRPTLAGSAAIATTIPVRPTIRVRKLGTRNAARTLEMLNDNKLYHDWVNWTRRRARRSDGHNGARCTRDRKSRSATLRKSAAGSPWDADRARSRLPVRYWAQSHQHCCVLTALVSTEGRYGPASAPTQLAMYSIDASGFWI
jgi:hypothetical protein